MNISADDCLVSSSNEPFLKPTLTKFRWRRMALLWANVFKMYWYIVKPKRWVNSAVMEGGPSRVHGVYELLEIGKQQLETHLQTVSIVFKLRNLPCCIDGLVHGIRNSVANTLKLRFLELCWRVNMCWLSSKVFCIDVSRFGSCVSIYIRNAIIQEDLIVKTPD